MTSISDGTDAGTFRSWFTRAGLRHALGNLVIASMFFVALVPSRATYGNALTDYIWLIGAALMGVLTLVRIPPRSAMINGRSIAATGAMIILPALIQPSVPSTGALMDSALIIQLGGVVLSQAGRLCLGRRFALLPANRGIVSTGPYRFVRHPVYLGWLVLTIGRVMAYPSAINALILCGTLPLMVWRIALEEELLLEDPDYRSYAGATSYRLLPGIY